MNNSCSSQLLKTLKEKLNLKNIKTKKSPRDQLLYRGTAPG